MTYFVSRPNTSISSALYTDQIVTAHPTQPQPTKRIASEPESQAKLNFNLNVIKSQEDKTQITFDVAAELLAGRVIKNGHRASIRVCINVDTEIKYMYIPKYILFLLVNSKKLIRLKYIQISSRNVNLLRVVGFISNSANIVKMNSLDYYNEQHLLILYNFIYYFIAVLH